MARAVLSVAHAPFCPPARLRGKKRELERCCLLCAERVLAKASKSYQSGAQVSDRLSEKRGGGAGPGLVLGSRPKGAKTHDAMSRRKLGSRPQHLSAIQGKRRVGARREENTLFLVGFTRGVFIMIVKFRHKKK